MRYDNRVENVSIPERYNDFIERRMADGWVVFMHHDLDFDADPWPRIRELPTDAIYGVCGSRLERGFRYVFVGYNRVEGFRFATGHRYHQRVLGRIKCPKELAASGYAGESIVDTAVVSTVDCCCLIVHASLVRRCRLRFDPAFAWHFYSEDFSLSARRAHGIETRVVQLDCGHYGRGSVDEEFSRTRDRLVEKHRDLQFASTCYLPARAERVERLITSRGLLLQY